MPTRDRKGGKPYHNFTQTKKRLKKRLKDHSWGDRLNIHKVESSNTVVYHLAEELGLGFFRCRRDMGNCHMGSFRVWYMIGDDCAKTGQVGSERGGSTAYKGGGKARRYAQS